MSINPDKLMSLSIPDSTHSYTRRDSMLYALGLGLGADPVDIEQLRYVYEKEQLALPTMGVVLATPGLWVRDLDTGIDWRRLVHGEQGLVLHRPLPTHAKVIGHTRITRLIDKGPGKGALIYNERTVRDADSGELLCTNTQTMFCRADGGFGGSSGPVPVPHPVPARQPDARVQVRTLPQIALIYRLSGDMNPLHADPELARAAGFERPILHGLASFGIAGVALLKAGNFGHPERLQSMHCRFTAPVFPGETLETLIWADGVELSFRVRVVERDVIAIDNGRAILLGPSPTNTRHP